MGTGRALAVLLGLATGLTAGPAWAAEGEYDCLIEARQNLDIRSSVEGVIEALQVQRGSQVRKGQVIAQLFSGPERAALEVARSRATMEGELRSAEARLELTRKKFERTDELIKKNFVSAAARDEAEADFRLAQEQVRVAKENKRLAELEVKRAEEVVQQREIRSPVNGIVIDVMLRPGELTSSNQKDPIMKVAEVDPLNVELILPVSAFGKIKRGQMATVIPEAPVGGSYAAKVEIVDAVFDAASGTFGVRLALPNPQRRIPAGLKCRARFGVNPG